MHFYNEDTGAMSDFTELPEVIATEIVGLLQTALDERRPLQEELGE